MPQPSMDLGIPKKEKAFFVVHLFLLLIENLVLIRYRTRYGKAFLTWLYFKPGFLIAQGMR